MYKNILVPTDGTDFAAKAVDTAIGLAKLLNAEVTAVSVTPPFAMMAVEGVMITQPPEDYVRSSRETAERRLAPVAAAAKGAGLQCTTVHVEHFQPYEGIIEAAKANDCDLIVMASHGRRGLSAMVLGSETQKVLTHSKIPVLVCRPA